MSTLNYIVKGKKFYSNILVRFKNGRSFDFTTSTELKVEPKHWSQAKQKVKNIAGDKTKDIINNHLIDMKKFIIDDFNVDNSVGVYIDKEWLNKKIAKYFNRPLNESEMDKTFFIPYIENYIKEAPTKLIKGTNKPVSATTITKYGSTKKKLEAYEEHFETKIKFTDLDLSFHKNFLHFLSSVHNIGKNTSGKYISTIKAIAREALLQGLPVHKDINHPNFFAPTEKTQDIYLKDQEIDKIFDHDFEGNEKYENARDLFIIGLRTGLRVSDFLRLKQTNIKNGYIEIETQKTGHPVVIPMHSQVKKIIATRKGFPKTISDQKFNLYIKDVAKIAGIKAMTVGSKINPKTKRKEKGTYPKHELISSHICRRSFSSNLYGKIPNMTIMGITGHKTEVQFLKYIKITPKENAIALKKFWSSQNNTTQK